MKCIHCIFELWCESTKFDMIIVLVGTIAKVVPITAMVRSNFGHLSFELVVTM